MAKKPHGRPMLFLTRVGGGMVKRLLQPLGLRVTKIGSLDFLTPVLHWLLRKEKRLFFVQIGANDGKSHDPLYGIVVTNRDRVSGIAVEPLPDVFQRLQRTYAAYPNIKTVNVAIHNSATKMPMYRVAPERLKTVSAFADGIASFNREHLTRVNKFPEDSIVEETVRCVTLRRLLEDYDVRELDLLQIDAEGYDVDIIEGIDFSELKPRIIHFEHGVRKRALPRERLHQVMARLHDAGYEVMLEPNDLLAYQPNVMLGRT